MDWKLTTIIALAQAVVGVAGDCTTPPAISGAEATQVGVFENLFTLTCSADDKIFTEDNPVLLSDCVNDQWTHNAESLCNANFVVTDFDCPEHTAPDGALLLKNISKDGKEVGKLYECEPGKAWLSGKRVQMTTCKKDAQWTDIIDVCDDDCSVPRDCVDVVSLGFNESNVYFVIPSGNPHDAALKLECCGVDGKSDWVKANMTVPDSCYPKGTFKTGAAFTRGCYKVISDNISYYSQIFIGCMVALIVFMVISICAVCTLVKSNKGYTPMV